MSCVPLPRLHVVTDDGVVARGDFVDKAAALLEAGGERLALHLRAPRTSGRIVFDLAERLAGMAAGSGSRLIVNDRLDVALAAGAAGAQVGGRGLAAQDARRVLGVGRLLGVSVHDEAEAERAVHGGADYLLAGTLYPTASHPGRAPAGTRWLESLRGMGARVIGIGGIGLERVRDVIASGAWGVAAIRAIWEAERPHQEALRFIDALY